MSELIFSGSNLAYWIFGLCFATSIGLIFFPLEHMRLQLNCVLVPEKRVPAFPPRARSLDEFVLKTNVLGHYLGVLDEYRHLYPSSPLPRIVVSAVVSMLLSMIGIFACGLLT